MIKKTKYSEKKTSEKRHKSTFAEFTIGRIFFSIYINTYTKCLTIN